ncbi:hypothetical protein K5M42_01320, partial [Serratia marcescens]|uniref:hypothetical protein n=1 Tax=Serratia marcescens TaxID=615 RepID=UPI001C8CB38D
AKKFFNNQINVKICKQKSLFVKAMPTITETYLPSLGNRATTSSGFDQGQGKKPRQRTMLMNA